ncbi:oxidoreductase [Malaciobacter halophilus]|uniref:Oxidoreductase n=2 Tax=Malaciobacter halophilus TaxID=197482 RepID=A0A2N1J030_9BACT|nr:choline dehydrogenase [Malaciobacter halophilus]PKI79915.1 oxidoreductase [Malaciobacter halophilus]
MVYDICIIGSGAGAAPIAYELTKIGKKVLILEKGSIYTKDDFSKDELAFVRKDILTPKLEDEYHTIEELTSQGWKKFPTYETGWNWWNGSLLGGSSNLMSGYFHRLKPKDFKLKTIYGKPKDSNIEDWPISYDDLEKYYTKVEEVVGVSGEVTNYKYQEPRSKQNYAFKPLKEHPITKLFDKACKELGYTSYKVPRAIISEDKNHRKSCYYSNFCGSYGCSSGAKSGAMSSLIIDALKTNNLTIKANSFVYKLSSNKSKVTKAHFYTKNQQKQTVQAKIFIVAAQAVETSRLLLNSKNSFYPNGIANSSKQVGKNMIFSGGGIGSAEFTQNNDLTYEELFTQGLFVNRALKDWYYTSSFKGGTIDFLFDHANPIRKANLYKTDEKDNFLFGKELQENIYKNFTQKRVLNFEIFTDWTPNDNCFVSVDDKYKDKYGIPVANIRIGAHKQDLELANFLASKAKNVLEQMGGKNIKVNMSALPSQNLQAGGCRFGNDKNSSVLNKYCQSHDLHNLFVTDGSFMPTGGSVPHTWTIYANSFRVADYIKETIF